MAVSSAWGRYIGPAMNPEEIRQLRQARGETVRQFAAVLCVDKVHLGELGTR